jgi:NhaP-type Na+/H+ or K+/H+ antiporter
MALQVLVAGLVVFAAHFLVLLFQKTKVPDVLILMLGGIVVGPLLGILRPEHFGVAGSVATTVALIVILFESGLNLSLRSLASAFGQTMVISLLMWCITAATVAVIMRALTPVSWPMAIMAGAIMGGTSSAVVVPLIDALKMAPKPRTVLFLESALTDVLCIVGAVAMLAAVQGQGVGPGRILQSIAASFGMALIIGVLAGFCWSLLMGKVRQFPNTIFTTVAYVFVVYGVSEMWGFSGAIAALAFGVTLSSLGGFHLGRREGGIEIKEVSEVDRLFFAEAVFLLKTFFFIYLGISLRFDSVVYFLIALAIIVPVYVERFGLIRLVASRGYSRRDAALMTTMVPKGLAAAVLATLPAQHGLQHAEWVSGTVYMVVLCSITLTAILVLLIEKTPIRGVYLSVFRTFAPVEPALRADEAAPEPALAPIDPAGPAGPAEPPPAPPPEIEVDVPPPASEP